MPDDIIESLLQQLHVPGANVLTLLEAYQGEGYARCWQQDARLYRAFGKALIAAGHPTRAFELVRAGLVHHAADLEVQYLSALALARGGNASKAMEYVETLLQVPALDRRL
jgi:hypothetical protein